MGGRIATIRPPVFLASYVRAPTPSLARPFSKVLSLDGGGQTGDERHPSRRLGDRDLVTRGSVPPPLKKRLTRCRSTLICPQPSSDKPNPTGRAEAQSGSS